MYSILDCTNTEILMYCIHRQYNYSVPYYTRTLLVQTNKHDVSAPCRRLTGGLPMMVNHKGRDRLGMVVELKVQYCRDIFYDLFKNYKTF